MYPDGQSISLLCELNLLLSCFGLSALHSLAHILKKLTQPAGLYSIPQWWYIHTGTVPYGRGHLGSIWEKKRRSPSFTHLAVLFIYVQYFAFCCRGLDFRPRTSSTASSENSFRVRSSRWNNRTVRKVLADFAVCDWWRFCNALCDVKFRHIL